MLLKIEDELLKRHLPLATHDFVKGHALLERMPFGLHGFQCVPVWFVGLENTKKKNSQKTCQQQF